MTLTPYNKANLDRVLRVLSVAFMECCALSIEECDPERRRRAFEAISQAEAHIIAGIHIANRELEDADTR